MRDTLIQVVGRPSQPMPDSPTPGDTWQWVFAESLDDVGCLPDALVVDLEGGLTSEVEVLARFPSMPALLLRESGIPTDLASQLADKIEEYRIRKRLLKLKQLGGPKLVTELVALVETNLKPMVQAVHAAAEAGDRSTIARLTHNLKSGAGNLGAAALADCAEELERSAQAGKPPAAAVIECLQPTFERAQRFLNKYATS